ncbi:MAG: protein-tyrosine phosphatase family protein [Bryobacteraceae bacterium]
MFTELFQVEGPWPGRLAISARPRGGDWLDQEMRAWRHAGIDVVVSLLEPAEAADLDLARERVHSEANGIEFHSFPIPDRSVPAGVKIRNFVSDLDSKLSQRKNVAIHCRQGIGRAGLIAAALLIEQGLGPEEAIRRVSTARHVPIPETEEQRLWIESFAAALARKP